MTERLSVLNSDAVTTLGTAPVAISRMTSAHFSFAWFEGIAIVQAVCRALQNPASRTDGVPITAANIVIDASGSVSVHGASVDAGPSGVRQVASLLRSVMPDELPVSLRLVLSQALAEPPFYESIENLSQALAYFERPDPTAIIREVVHRWERTGATSKPREPQATVADSIVEKPLESGRWRAPLSRSDIATVLLSAGTLSVLIAVGFLAFTGRPAQWTNDGAGASEAAAKPAAEDSGAAKPTTTRAAHTTMVSAVGASAAASHADSGRSVEFGLSVGPSADDEGAPPLLPDARSQPPLMPPFAVLDASSVQTAPRAPLREEPLTIYSVSDEDVAPPVAVYPRFPSEETVRQLGMPLVFDVVIDHSGAVESVKLRRPPASMADALVLTMTLSAAKTWRFQPATRNGESVRYRREIWIPR